MLIRPVAVLSLVLTVLSLSACGPSSKDLMTFLKPGNHKMSWKKQCGDLPGHKLPGEGKGVCWTKYEHVSPRSGKIVLFAGVKMSPKVEQQELVFAVPAGVNIERGMRIKFDEEAPLKVNYSHCEEKVCIAQLALTNEMLIKLKYKKRLIVAVMTKYGKAYGYKVPLFRFTYAYNSPPEKAVKTANNG